VSYQQQQLQLKQLQIQYQSTTEPLNYLTRIEWPQPSAHWPGNGMESTSLPTFWSVALL
jgi:hypothetical protein